MGHGMLRARHVLARPAGSIIVLLAGLALGGCSDAEAPGSAYRTVPDGDPARGRVLMARYQCGRCHAVPGAPSASVTTGPSLDGFGRRSYIAGRVPNTPQTLQRWLQSPSAVVPGTAMPALGVSPADARDLAAYLLSLS
jgi:cytochrome c